MGCGPRPRGMEEWDRITHAYEAEVDWWHFNTWITVKVATYWSYVVSDRYFEDAMAHAFDRNAHGWDDRKVEDSTTLFMCRLDQPSFFRVYRFGHPLYHSTCRYGIKNYGGI